MQIIADLHNNIRRTLLEASPDYSPPMQRSRATGSRIGCRLYTQRATRNPKATHQTCKGFMFVPLSMTGKPRAFP